MFIVKKLGIKNIGNIRLEQYGQTTLYSMNEAVKDIDDINRRQMRQITGNIKIHISNIFAEINVCPIARVAISSAIRLPLFESIANNHFTTELMPDNFESYRNRIIEMIRDEYISLSSFSKEIQCTRDSLPSWEEIKKHLLECIDLWLNRITREVIRCCEKKIAIYKKYHIDFEASKDNYRAEITRKCIEKNERYIDILKTRVR